MADAIPNLGLTTRISIYVEGSKLGRDYTEVLDWTAKTEYYEGTKEVLGSSANSAWQAPKGASGSFNFLESDAQYCGKIEAAIRQLELTGQRPSITIVELVNSTTGTTAKATYEKCVLKFSKAAPSRGAERKRSVEWRTGSIEKNE
jgi:hypothetical protein